MSEPTNQVNPIETHLSDHARVSERLRFADEAEALLRAILEALGYSASVTPADLLTGVAAWLSVVRRWTADPTGLVASFWASVFQSAFRASNMLTADGRRGEATEAADAATLAYQRRFPPLLEDGDAVSRDTVDDLEALREALDRQTEATAWAAAKAEQAESEKVRAREELKNSIGTLNQVAASVGVSSHSDLLGAVTGLRALADAAEAARDEREATIMLLESQRATMAQQLEAALARAFVSLPKPSQAEPGQCWVITVSHVFADGDPRVFGGKEWLRWSNLIGDENAHYVGMSEVK